MPIMIGVIGGLLDGLGISLISKGEVFLGVAWFAMGLAVVAALLARINQASPKSVETIKISGEKREEPFEKR